MYSQLAGETTQDAQKILSDVEKYCISIDEAPSTNEAAQQLIR